ncbi:MAG: sigma-70 family RNA polymerase sigma factor [Candidatus Dadabacteria bacterium]|nr:MAG: sigma-70 family RNA polymerase sigma factor [Candidatus Dadabacteria bacterium]
MDKKMLALEEEGLKSDEELVEEFRNGKKEAVVPLMLRYLEKAQGLALRITRDEEETREVIQDVFLTLQAKLHTFEGKSQFSSWLYRITVNAAFMRLRQRKKHAAISFDSYQTPNIMDSSWMSPRSDSTDVNYMTSRHELREALQRAIEKLPEDYKAIFILRDVDGLSNEEVSEILGLSVPAVKSRLHRARLMLRKKLKRFYQDYIDEEHIYLGPRPGISLDGKKLEAA